MGRQSLLSLVFIALLVVGGCATGQLNGNPADAVGMREADLVAQKGQPQQIIPTPEGGKIFVYENHRMDQVAIMRGGTWDKPEQTYYWLSPQGQVEQTKYFPYGKRKFLFNPDREPIQAAAAPARPQTPPPLPWSRIPGNLSRPLLRCLQPRSPRDLQLLPLRRPSPSLPRRPHQFRLTKA